MAFFNRTRVFGGAEESLLANAKEFLRRGLEVVVICSLDGVVAGRLSEAGLKVRRLLPRNDFRARRHSLLRRVSDSIECRAKAKDSDLAMRVAELACRAETSRLLVALRELKPSVFFANMCVSADHSFLRCASRLGIPSVSHQQVTPVAWTGRRVVSEANAMCEWFVSNSEWTRRAWVNSGLRSERHEVAYNMIVKPPPANESLRDRLSLGRDSKLIVSVGRLDPTKKFDDGIRAFAEVAPRFPGWHYVIIGDGEERTRLGQLASVSGAGERIHFPGWLLRADSYLEQIDVLLHPTPAEHFGRVVAEAMLAGATALGHASGGVTEMIDDGVTGHLFHDERSMRDCLE
ncbi:MAG: glycosyltransferase, partial [Opitutaceae bacterium]